MNDFENLILMFIAVVASIAVGVLVYSVWHYAARLW
jgi:heme/copper-type cytochrome/quinol oxidase subunit 2